jgi:hypothetical protein
MLAAPLTSSLPLASAALMAAATCEKTEGAWLSQKFHVHKNWS